MIDILRDIDRFPIDFLGMGWSLYLVLYSYTYPIEKHPVLAVMWGIDLNVPWCNIITYSGMTCCLAMMASAFRAVRAGKRNDIEDRLHHQRRTVFAGMFQCIVLALSARYKTSKVDLAILLLQAGYCMYYWKAEGVVRAQYDRAADIRRMKELAEKLGNLLFKEQSHSVTKDHAQKQAQKEAQQRMRRASETAGNGVHHENGGDGGIPGPAYLIQRRRSMI